MEELERLDPQSSSYAYKTKADAKEYKREIDDSHDISPEFRKERDDIEQQVFKQVGMLTKKYNDIIMNIIGTSPAQPSTPSGSPGVSPGASSPQSPPTTPSPAKPPGTQPSDSKEEAPGWRGLRGALRWLWYGKHRDNPDYLNYKSPNQNESLSLEQYRSLKERASETADKIVEKTFEHILCEDVTNQIQSVLNQYKSDLIRLILRPYLHNAWRVGVKHGSSLSSPASQDQAIEPTTSTDPQVPSVGAGAEEVGTTKPPEPRRHPDDVKAKKDEPVQDEPADAPPGMPVDTPARAGKGQKKNQPISHDDFIEKIVSKTNNFTDVFNDPYSIAYLMSQTGVSKTKALKKLMDKIPVDYYHGSKNINDSVSKLKEAGWEIKDLNGLKDLYVTPKINKDEVSEMKGNELLDKYPDLPHILNLNAAMKLGSDVDLGKIKSRMRSQEDEEFSRRATERLSAFGKDVEKRKTSQAAKAKQTQRTPEPSEPPVVEPEPRTPEPIEPPKAKTKRKPKSKPDEPEQTSKPKVIGLGHDASGDEDPSAYVTKGNVDFVPKKRPKKQRSGIVNISDEEREEKRRQSIERAKAKEKETKPSGQKLSQAGEEAAKRVKSVTSPSKPKVFDPANTPKKGDDKETVKKYIHNAMMSAKSAAEKEAKEKGEPIDPDWDLKPKNELFRVLDNWIDGNPKRTDSVFNYIEKLRGFKDQEYESLEDDIADPGTTRKSSTTDESTQYVIGKRWLEFLTLDARKEYYKSLLREGIKGPHITRKLIDNLPIDERKKYYKNLLKEN